MNGKLSGVTLALIVLFFVSSYFPLFLHLSKEPIQVWDESLYAVNALEMEANGQYIVKYFYGEPDMWNTKPPLIVWIQILFFKLFGYNELSLRLPSAIAGVLTLALLIRFSWTEFGNICIGAFAGLCLLTSRGYITDHVTRTGDLDAALVLFLTAACLYFYKFIENHDGKSFNLWLFTVALILACLTKGVTGVLFLPGLFLFALLRKKIAAVFAYRQTYVAILAFVVFVGGYYALRESLNPGYLTAVWQNELGGRYFETLENHKESFWFYFTQLVHVQFTPWIGFFPLAIALSLYAGDKRVKVFTTMALCVVLTFWLIISTAQTKLAWYDAPMLPLMATVIALGLYRVVLALLANMSLNQTGRIAIVTVVVLSAFGLPYYNTIYRIIKTRDVYAESKYGFFMRNVERLQPGLKRYTILHTGWTPHLEFYRLASLREKKIERKRANDLHLVGAGDTVMACQHDALDYLRNRFNVKVLDRYNECEFVVLNPRTSDEQ